MFLASKQTSPGAPQQHPLEQSQRKQRQRRGEGGHLERTFSICEVRMATVIESCQSGGGGKGSNYRFVPGTGKRRRRLIAWQMRYIWEIVQHISHSIFVAFSSLPVCARSKKRANVLRLINYRCFSFAFSFSFAACRRTPRRVRAVARDWDCESYWD